MFPAESSASESGSDSVVLEPAIFDDGATSPLACWRKSSTPLVPSRLAVYRCFSGIANGIARDADEACIAGDIGAPGVDGFMAAEQPARAKTITSVVGTRTSNPP